MFKQASGAAAERSGENTFHSGAACVVVARLHAPVKLLYTRLSYRQADAGGAISKWTNRIRNKLSQCATNDRDTFYCSNDIFYHFIIMITIIINHKIIKMCVLEDRCVLY